MWLGLDWCLYCPFNHLQVHTRTRLPYDCWRNARSPSPASYGQLIKECTSITIRRSCQASEFRIHVLFHSRSLLSTFLPNPPSYFRMLDAWEYFEINLNVACLTFIVVDEPLSGCHVDRVFHIDWTNRKVAASAQFILPSKARLFTCQSFVKGHQFIHPRKKWVI